MGERTDNCGLCIHYRVWGYRGTTMGWQDICKLLGTKNAPKIVHHYDPACERIEKVPAIAQRAPKRKIVSQVAEEWGSGDSLFNVLECGHKTFAVDPTNLEDDFCYQCPHTDGSPKWSWLKDDECSEEVKNDAERG